MAWSFDELLKVLESLDLGSKQWREMKGASNCKEFEGSWTIDDIISISIMWYVHFSKYCRDSVFALSWRPASTGHPDVSKPWRSNVLKLLDAGVTWLRQCCERIWLGKSTRLKARQTWWSEWLIHEHAGPKHFHSLPSSSSHGKTLTPVQRTKIKQWMGTHIF